jgi:hypothetical protein
MQMFPMEGCIFDPSSNLTRMNKMVFNEILNHLFGKKYYAVVVGTRGTTKQDICSYIFADKDSANKHRQEIELNNRSFQFVDIISFRSKRITTSITLM